MVKITNYLFKDDPKRILFTFSAIFILVASAIGIYVVSSISKVNSAYQLTSEVQKALSLTNKADQYKKDFLQANSVESYSTNEELAKSQFDPTLSRVDEILSNQLRSSIIGKRQEKDIQRILSDINQYKSMFHRVIELYTEKYTPITGLAAQMNAALQSVEQSELPVNMIPIVSLKKNQKDFEQKRELRFYQNFQEESTLFLTDIGSFETRNSENSLQKEILLNNVNSFISYFGKIVELEKEVGLSGKDGLKGKLSFTFQSIDGTLNQLNRALELSSIATAQYIKYSMVILFIFIILAIIAILNYFIRYIYNPILEIQQSADQIAHGDLNINLDKIKSNNLLKNIVDTFGNMINKLELTLYQIEEIARLNLNNKIDLSSENDMIGKSVHNVQKQLLEFTDKEKLAKIEDEKRNWVTEGLAMFSNFLRGNGDLKNISQTIISNLVKYLKANQGGLYIVNSNEDGEKFIELTACYAYERIKYINRRLEIGEGLIGQCYLEKESIFMSDIPENYLRITSGLGDANPRCILIVPAKINENIEAIIEIASFHEFEKYQIDFVEKLAENIASTIWSIQVNEKTKRLLEESQLQTEEMKSKEEEMQQNIEELASIQEEMNRKEKFYQSKIEELEKALQTGQVNNYQLS